LTDAHVSIGANTSLLISIHLYTCTPIVYFLVVRKWMIAALVAAGRPWFS